MSERKLRTFNPAELGTTAVDLNAIPIRDKLDIEQLVFRQMLATDQSASQDESIFAANVRTLMSYLPITQKRAVEERRDEYVKTVEHWEYKTFCNVQLNLQNDPKLQKELGSPFLVTDEVTDWHALRDIINETFQELGVTWKFDDWEKELRKVKDTPEFQRTPLLENIYHAEPPVSTNQEEKVHLLHCFNPTCRAVIHPGEGLHKYGHLFCKNCTNVADEKYGSKPTTTEVK